MTKTDFNRLAHEVFDEAIKLLLSCTPSIQSIVDEAVETIFAPKVVVRKLALAIALETGLISLNQVFSIVKYIYANFSSRSRLIRNLEEKQNKALTQDEWMDFAETIDNIQGNDVWRQEPSCPLYEEKRISTKISEYVQLMRRGDVFDLMFTLRGGISRNQFGLLHEGLFSKALAGTKVLVETYQYTICNGLNYICNQPSSLNDDSIPIDVKLAFFNETRHSYGRSAFMFSGGAALGFYHIGVAKAMMANGLMPRVISGASAGSIICAMIGTRTDEECKDFFDVLEPSDIPKREPLLNKGTNSFGHSGKLMLNFFRPVKQKKVVIAGQFGGVQQFLNDSAGTFTDSKKTWQALFLIGVRNFTSTVYDILRGQKRAKDVLMNDTEFFRKCCEANIGSFTFQEAFDRTGRILNIVVSPQNNSDPPRLLNYLTAPHVLVWSAAVASSSLPGVFEPSKLLCKDADGFERYESSSTTFIDGSMEADLPFQQISEMFNVNHFIVSQANPHAIMFGVSESIWSNRVLGLVSGILLHLKQELKDWFGNIFNLITGQRAVPMFDTKRLVFGSSIFMQNYQGRDIDVTINPWINHRSILSAFCHGIYNPTDEELIDWVKAAERETWRHIPKIKSRVAVEMTLDNCVSNLRNQLLSENNHSGQSSRVPSFAKMSGYSVADSQHVREEEKNTLHIHPKTMEYKDKSKSTLDISTGWKGLGLRGNYSSGSLKELGKNASIADDQSVGTSNSGKSSQMPGEVPGYVKLSNMANFYYRRSGALDVEETENNLDQ